MRLPWKKMALAAAACSLPASLAAAPVALAQFRGGSVLHAVVVQDARPDGAAPAGDTISSPARGGNLLVEVPVTPEPRALPALCTAFMEAGQNERHGAGFQVLVGATGGTDSATATWCARYLDLQRGDSNR